MSDIPEIQLTLAFLLEMTIFEQEELYRMFVTQMSILSGLEKNFPDLGREIQKAKASIERTMGKQHKETIRLLRKVHADSKASVRKSRGKTMPATTRGSAD
jgi:hypothetical protein